VKRHLAPVLLPLLVPVAGCGGGSPPPGDHVVVTATDDFRFSPSQVELSTGPVRIQLRNSGSYPHNISIPQLQVTSSTVSGSFGSQSTTVPVTIRRPGTYRFLCTYHDQAGMTGTLVVR
jgi:plastocyanin